MSNQKRSKNNTNKKTEKQFTVNIRVVPTTELIPQKGVTNDLTIEDLKIMAEYTAGVPTNLQRLAYLDQENLKDDSAVQDYDVVSNSELRLDVWLTWKKLIEVAAYGDSELLFQQGITLDSKFSSPTLNYMSSQERRRVLAERGFVALYVAAHHNHKLLCEILLKAGININATTSETGRTALHVAAAQGHCDIVDLLLEHGADIDIKDELGETAMMVGYLILHINVEHITLRHYSQVKS